MSESLRNIIDLLMIKAISIYQKICTRTEIALLQHQLSCLNKYEKQFLECIFLEETIDLVFQRLLSSTVISNELKKLGR